jgi:capsular polysaccharide biosynthesis protein
MYVHSKNSDAVKYVELYPDRYFLRKKYISEENVFIDALQKWNSWKFTADYTVIIPNGTAYSDSNAPRTADVILRDNANNILTDLSYGNLEADILIPKTHLEGTVVFLNARHGRRCYFHWLFDVVSRLKLVTDMGYSLDNINYFVVPNLEQQYKKETLKTLGIPLHKIIYSQYVHITADNLIVPSSFYTSTNHSSVTEWKCEFLRNELLSRTLPTNYGEKIYLIRGEQKWRNITNEKELISLLNTFGFSAVNMESISVEEESALLNRAKIVISCHGSALSTIVFCKPKTKIVDIFPTKRITQDSAMISDMCDLDYFFFINNLQEQGPDSIHDSFQIDLERFSNFLRRNKLN